MWVTADKDGHERTGYGGCVFLGGQAVKRPYTGLYAGVLGPFRALAVGCCPPQCSPLQHASYPRPPTAAAAVIPRCPCCVTR